MHISKRLKAVADMVPNSLILADIGTDHAYLPIYLIKEGVISKAIASDIKSGPLEKARKNIQDYRLEEKIKTCLGGGLTPLKELKEEPKTVVISGMGGLTIIDILNSDAFKDAGRIDSLILQPQSEIYNVRQALHRLNFKIDDEEMVLEEGKFYNIIKASYGKDMEYTNIDYTLGKRLIAKKHPVLKKYIESVIKKNGEILSVLEKTGTPKADIRIKEVLSENQMYREVLSCL